MVCALKDASALPTVLRSEVYFATHDHVVDRRLHKCRCLLHPPIFPVESARARSQMEGEERGHGDRSRLIKVSRRPNTRWERGGALYERKVRVTPAPPPLHG